MHTWYVVRRTYQLFWGGFNIYQVVICCAWGGQKALVDKLPAFFFGDRGRDAMETGMTWHGMTYRDGRGTVYLLVTRTIRPPPPWGRFPSRFLSKALP